MYTVQNSHTLLTEKLTDQFVTIFEHFTQGQQNKSNGREQTRGKWKGFITAVQQAVNWTQWRSVFALISALRIVFYTITSLDFCVSVISALSFPLLPIE